MYLRASLFISFHFDRLDLYPKSFIEHRNIIGIRSSNLLGCTIRLFTSKSSLLVVKIPETRVIGP